MAEGSVRAAAGAVTPGYPLDNTGALEWSLGGAGGLRRGALELRLSARRYAARLGVCGCLRMESADDFYAQLERDRPVDADLYRSEFAVERPSQDVVHDLVLARASRALAGVGTLTATAALQHDRRREFDVVRDGTTGPQFDFRLLTGDLEVALAHRLLHLTERLHLRGGAGVVAMVQDHRYEGLPLVPDHAAASVGAYVSERLLGHDFEVEAGARYELLDRTASIARRDFLRLVRSGQIAEDACGDPAADVARCGSRFHTLSASLGALRQLSASAVLKADVSVASRAPNPDEQYLNGTAPTFPVYGLGKPDLRPETSYGASVTASHAGDRLAAELSLHASYIDDYIYFAPALGPDGEPIFDVLIRGSFPRFTTRPVDAVFYGADGGVTARPWPWLELTAQLSVVRARQADGGWLVFVPPDRLRAGAAVRRDALGRLREVSLGVTTTLAARQDRFDPAADLAPPPDGYALLGAELAATVDVQGRPVALSLTGSNLLDARYREYTSLARYFVDQPGWQALLRASVRFGEERRP
jgi:iron complex outermembrane receptor protein